MCDDRKTFICQIDSFAINQLNQFDHAIQQIWKNMYDIHIEPEPNKKGKKKNTFTRYIDYAKKIRENEIQIPLWFILTSGTMIQKLIPDYVNALDALSIGLIDTHTIRGKSMMVYHTSEMMQRNGMHVSDTITQNIMKIFSNPFGLLYIRLFSSSPEECFFIKDHYSSYYQHLKHGLLEENLLRIMVISSRHLLLLIEIMREQKIDLVREITLINPKRGKQLYETLCDPKNESMEGIFTKIWPRLKSIIMIEHGTMRIYLPQLKFFIKEIKTYCPIYAIPEATIGYDRDNSGTYTVDPRNGFFEFVKIRKNNSMEISNIRTLEIGSMYHIIVTNKFTRMNRYLTDEIVKISGYMAGTPKFEVQCKEYELINKNERVLTPYQIEDVLINQLDLVDYCYSDTENEKLCIWIELTKHHYVSDTKRTYDIKKGIKGIKIKDYIISQLDLHTDIKIIMPGTINMLYQNRYSDYVDPGSVHIPRNISNPHDIDILRNGILFTF